MSPLPPFLHILLRDRIAAFWRGLVWVHVSMIGTVAILYLASAIEVVLGRLSGALVIVAASVLAGEALQHVLPRKQ